MKLWFAIALILSAGKAPSQEPGKDVPVLPRNSPFILDLQHFDGKPSAPKMLHTSDFDLWKLAVQVAAEPPAHPPGVGIGIGGPIAELQIVEPGAQDQSGFKIAIYPRPAEKETGLMGISRVTSLAAHVTEERYLGWFNHKELRTLCEAEGTRLLAMQTPETPLHAYSVIANKDGSPGVWVERVYLVNVGEKPLLVEQATLRVLKAGTFEELRKAEVTWPPKMKRKDGKRQFELLPQRTWLALSAEWDALPDLKTQSCWARVEGSDIDFGFRVEVDRFIEAEIERY